MKGLLVFLLCSVGVVLFAQDSASADTGTIQFSGYTWDVKDSGGEVVGPGPNRFSSKGVWVDKQGRLHLRLFRENGTWKSAEVSLRQPLGYGTYQFDLEGRYDRWDPAVVLGMFTYDLEDPSAREIDIELSRWNQPKGRTTWYTLQPYDIKGNQAGFTSPLSGSYTRHRFQWTPLSLQFSSYHGHSSRFPMSKWAYPNPFVPRPGRETVRINLWRFQQGVITRPHEVIIHRFTFTPIGKNNLTPAR